MSSKRTRYIGALVVLAVVMAGGIYYSVMPHNKNLTTKQFSQLPIEQQFKNATEGHYIHLSKYDSTLYRTTWSKKEIKQYLVYTVGYSKLNADGTSKEKTTFGTNHTFDDSKLIDSEKGYGEIGKIWSDLFDNAKFNKNIEYTSENVYNWYFNNIDDAEKDADVKASVNQIVR